MAKAMLHARASTHLKISYYGISFPLCRYLSATDTENILDMLVPSQKITLLLFGKIKMDNIKFPEVFERTVPIYLVKNKTGIYFSYPQGWHGELRVWNDDAGVISWNTNTNAGTAASTMRTGMRGIRTTAAQGATASATAKGR
jgi:hypothetical protein